MKTVYKYELPDNIYDGEGLYGYFSLCLPVNAKILNVVSLNDKGVIYAEVDTEITDVKIRNFFVAGTGKELPCRDNTFIGTYLTKQYVWHLYELGNV